MKQRKNKKRKEPPKGDKVNNMTVKYNLLKERAQELMEGGNLNEICLDGFDAVVIYVDFSTKRVVIYGVNHLGEKALLDDNAYAYIPEVEEAAKEKEIRDIYISNKEIAQYLKLLEIPYQWALDAADEWRAPEEEEKVIDDELFWDAIDGIKTAYRISREEN